MSEFQRRGTVSRSSGPTHIYSYALKGIPIRYHPPSFVSDALRLSTNQKQPTLPSQNVFRYDYTKERKVLEQSRVRTLSVIAEAEASRKRQEEEQARRDSQPRAPVLSSTILLPTPAPGTGSGSNSDSEFTVPSGSSGNVNVTASLGQFIREIEGVDDPFEIASLQAINDMEMLQTVLQPTAASSAVVASPVTAATSAATTPGQARTVPTLASRAPVINQPVAPQTSQPQAHVMNQPPVANPALVVNPAPVASHPQPLPPVSQLPHQTQSHHTGTANSVDDLSVLFGGTPSAIAGSPPTHVSPTATVPLPTAAAVAVTNTNPFLSGSPAFNSAPIGCNNPFLSQGPPPTAAVAPGNGPAAAVGLPNAIDTARVSPTLGASPSSVPAEPSVGTLIDIGAQLHVTPSPPIPIPRTLPSYAAVVSPSSAPHLSNQQPQTQLSPSLDNGPTAVGFARSSGGPPPPVPPKPHPHPHPTATPISTAGNAAGVRGSDTVNPPPRPPKPVAPSLAPVATVQSRVQALVANLPKLPNRPGLGIPVLPPISNATTTSTTAAGPSVPQPSPPMPAPRHTPPPPYYAEQALEGVRSRPQQAPTPRPRTYKLPDPSPGMSAEEKATVQSLSGMGFPGPRVARVVKRFDNDRTKTVDFLIAVGKLEEEEGYSGDGAETALIASGEDHNKALDYLKRVKQYKDIGFSEKAIHEAHEKADKDWDKVLDILTQAR